MIVENTSAVPTWAPNQQERGATHPSAFGPQSMYHGSHSKFCQGVYGDLCIHDGYFQLQERYIRLRLMQVKIGFTGKCPGISSRDTRSIVDLGENQRRLSPAVLLCISPLDLILIDKCSLWMCGRKWGLSFSLTPSSSHGGRKPFPTSSGRKIPGGTWIGFGSMSTSVWTNPCGQRNKILWSSRPGWSGFRASALLKLHDVCSPWERVFLCTSWIKVTGRHQTDLRRPAMILSLETFEGGTTAYHNVAMGLSWWSSG